MEHDNIVRNATSVCTQQHHKHKITHGSDKASLINSRCSLGVNVEGWVTAFLGDSTTAESARWIDGIASFFNCNLNSKTEQLQ